MCINFLIFESLDNLATITKSIATPIHETNTGIDHTKFIIPKRNLLMKYSAITQNIPAKIIPVEIIYSNFIFFTARKYNKINSPKRYNNIGKLIFINQFISGVVK